MYGASAWRVSVEPAGMRIDGVYREAAVGPVDHGIGEALVQQLALQEERDDSLAEAGSATCV